MIFIDACKRVDTPYTPVWMMRQAGRYLREYREVRSRAGSFLDMCKDVDTAVDITLQPVDILDVDAAILFSDILLLPSSMGLRLEFTEGYGPKFLDTILDASSISRLSEGAFVGLDYVYDTVRKTRAKLSKDKALIGFSGAPWTLATYIIEGQKTSSFSKSKRFLYCNPKLMHDLMEVLANEVLGYLDFQIKAGADAVMIFDSWAGALECSSYLKFGWHYILRICDGIKLKHPDTPIIVFPMGTGTFIDRLNGNFDVFSVDWHTPIEYAKKMIGDRYVIQGNMDPCRLYDMESTKASLDEIIGTMGNQPGHVINLGHGMLPDIPRENAVEFVKMAKEMSSR